MIILVDWRIDPPACLLLSEAGSELDVYFQNMLLNPFLHHPMQTPDQLDFETLNLALPFVIPDEAPETFVFLLVLRMGRTAESIHALLLHLEMDVSIIGYVVHEVDQTFHRLRRGLGGVQMFL